MTEIARTTLLGITLRAGVSALVVFSAVCAGQAATCESLATLALPDTTIVVAKLEPAGTFNLPKPSSMFGERVDNLPAFCRVAAEVKPTKDSDIKLEVWMPASGWNGKFMGVGNGGWSGEIWYSPMGEALRRGYATASTDTGHEGNGFDASFALGHPEKVFDFGYRAVHEMTVKAKAIIAAYYAADALKHSYWNGCSSGGKQGLKEAQRFPKDYEGIIAGAPVNFWTHLVVSAIWIGQATHENPAGYLPKEKYSVLHRAVIEACDALDGVKDGVLENPKRCHFDPKVVECKGAAGPDCLTAAQVGAAKKIYDGPKNPRTGEQIFPGLEPGSENGWSFFGRMEPEIIGAHFEYLVFHDPKWDYRTLNFDSDVALADKLDNGVLNATNPNLKGFFEQGGKLLLYHGWADGGVPPQNTINYYESVVDAMGGLASVQNSMILFMAPGMGHCFGGDGPFAFDSIAALEQWVEKGKAPDRIVAAHFPPGSDTGKPDRTRPLCPYPQVAKYIGSGSTDDASNFVCTKE